MCAWAPKSGRARCERATQIKVTTHTLGNDVSLITCFGPWGHSRDPPPVGGLLADPPPPLVVHVVVECPHL